MSCTETGAQLLARLGSRPNVSEISRKLFPSGIKGKDVIEFYGSEGTGKTEMLLDLVASIILPKSWNGLKLNGADACIIFIDTDYKFSILRLVTLLEKRINRAQKDNEEKRKLSKPNDSVTVTASSAVDCGDDLKINKSDEKMFSSDNIEHFIKECLKNISVIHCTSSSQLVVTLSNLENSVSNNPNICVIMIDSISAFYWIDRCNGGESASLQEMNMNRIVSVLSQLVSDYNLTLFSTKQALFRKRLWDDGRGDNLVASLDFKSDGEEHSEFLCKSWSKFVKHRVIFRKYQDSRKQTFFTADVAGTLKRKFVVHDSGIDFITE